MDKKADKINILIEKIIRDIRTMAALKVIITLYPRVAIKSMQLREFEKDYETVTWLCCVVEKTPEHCIVSCLFAKNMKTGYVE